MSAPRDDTDIAAKWRRGLRRLRLVEIALVYVGLIAAAEIFGFGDALLTTQPHPFWIPVLLFSLYEGLVPGLLAAMAAVLLNRLLSDAVLPVGSDFYDQLLAAAKEPILWIGAAAFIGAVRELQRARTVEALSAAGEYKSQRAAIARYARELRDHIRTLEQACAFRADDSMSDFRDALANMAAAEEPSAAHEHLQRACQIATGCASATILERYDLSWRSIEGVRPHIDPTPSLMAEVNGLATPRVLGPADHAAGAPAACRIAVPIADQDEDSVLILDGCPVRDDMTAVVAIGEFVADQWALRRKTGDATGPHRRSSNAPRPTRAVAIG